MMSVFFVTLTMLVFTTGIIAFTLYWRAKNRKVVTNKDVLFFAMVILIGVSAEVFVLLDWDFLYQQIFFLGLLAGFVWVLRKYHQWSRKPSRLFYKDLKQF